MISIIAEVSKSFNMRDKLYKASNEYKDAAKNSSIFAPFKKAQLYAASVRADKLGKLINSKINDEHLVYDKSDINLAKVFQHPKRELIDRINNQPEVKEMINRAEGGKSKVPENLKNLSSALKQTGMGIRNKIFKSFK